MAYNPWYTATYQPILEMANWNILTADIEEKVIGIFSWMPQTIMSIKHIGGRHKWEIYSVESVRAALEPLEARFTKIQNYSLRTFAIEKNKVIIEDLFGALSTIFGPVAASKYMHFSAPHLLPMWDDVIRNDLGHEASGQGYVRYIAGYKRQLKVPENYREAIKKCPRNAVRGWDMVCMERR